MGKLVALVATIAVVSVLCCAGVNVYAAGGVPVQVVNSSSKPVPVSTPCCYRFVGISSATTTGKGEGIFAMNKLCQASFGKSARMCSAPEYLSSPVVFDSDDSFEAWLNPVVIAVYFDTSQSAVTLVYYPDVRFPPSANFPDLACDDWTSEGSSHGFAATPTGWTAPHCTSSHPVACCAP